MPYQVNMLVLILGILQSWLVGVALLRKKGQHPSQSYLILFIVVVGLQLTFKAISKGWLWDHARTVYMVSYNFGYLIGPLIYLYFRTRRSSARFQRTDMLHVVPFVLSTIQTLLDELFGIIIPSVFPWPSLQLLSLAGYGLAAWKLSNAEPNGARRTLRQFLVSTVAVEIVIIITIAVMVRNNDMMPDIRVLFVALTALIYWITYKLISSPSSFTVVDDIPDVKRQVAAAVKYANSGLTKDESLRILTQLRHAIEEDKMFAQHDITLDDVSKKLGARKHHLSQVVNEHYSRSFTDLVNTWRLNEARSRLANPACRHEKISAIAYDVGFSSVSVFTTMFKKRFNVTPSACRVSGGRINVLTQDLDGQIR